MLDGNALTDIGPILDKTVSGIGMYTKNSPTLPQVTASLASLYSMLCVAT